MPAPSDFSRRSFVYRKLAALGAEFGELAGGAVALDFGDPRREAEAARRLGLCDLSLLPSERCERCCDLRTADYRSI